MSRRRGPPPGTPKPPNSGRQKGTRNKVSKEIAEIAQKHGKAIVDGLVKEFKGTDDLDVKDLRAHGEEVVVEKRNDDAALVSDDALHLHIHLAALGLVQ